MTEMMNDFTVVNILDAIDAVGEDEIKSILSDFSCRKNAEIEHFVRQNAVEFAKRKISITYLVMDRRGVRAVFTLTHKAIEVQNSILSNTMRRRLERYSESDEVTGNYTVSAFLIAQFGKNDAFCSEDSISGNVLMDYTFGVLTAVQHDIGGGIVYLECEDNEKLLSFYSAPPNQFIRFGERYSLQDRTKYIQMFRFI